MKTNAPNPFMADAMHRHTQTHPPPFTGPECQNGTHYRSYGSHGRAGHSAVRETVRCRASYTLPRPLFPCRVQRQWCARAYLMLKHTPFTQVTASAMNTDRDDIK